MKHTKMKKVFMQGAISPEKIANSIAHHQVKTNIGGHSIFLGQVRADEIEGKIVQAIDYSAYEDMAEKEFHTIRETAFEKFDLTCLHIYHSLGVVKAGEICLFVFTSSKHRAMAFDACRFITEEIKAKVPVFGKEIFEDATHQWKTNH
ncbi:MAG: molybdopterin converting factor [Bacteroidetes bacterium HGW-Bacteroidetes-12]|nr:MAG: molybdopterin converting factor [Bacteroidetes bacterium HGW-Bacteroidetes-12]